MVPPLHGLGALHVLQDANLCLGYAFPGSQTRMLTINTNDNIILMASGVRVVLNRESRFLYNFSQHLRDKNLGLLDHVQAFLRDKFWNGKAWV